MGGETYRSMPVGEIDGIASNPVEDRSLSPHFQGEGRSLSPHFQGLADDDLMALGHVSALH